MFYCCDCHNRFETERMISDPKSDQAVYVCPRCFSDDYEEIEVVENDVEK